ncbi:unnamed protein product [Sympodiomycopsis kandeliae]
MSSSSSDPQYYDGLDRQFSSSNHHQGSHSGSDPQSEEILVNQASRQLNIVDKGKGKMSAMDIDVDLTDHIPQPQRGQKLHHMINKDTLDAVIDDEDSDSDDERIQQPTPRTPSVAGAVRPSTPIPVAANKSAKANDAAAGVLTTPRAEKSDPLSSDSFSSRPSSYYNVELTPDTRQALLRATGHGSSSFEPIGSPASVLSQHGGSEGGTPSLTSASGASSATSSPVASPSRNIGHSASASVASGPSAGVTVTTTTVTTQESSNNKLEKEIIGLQWYKLDSREDSSGELFQALDDYLSQMEKLTGLLGTTQSKIKAILLVIDDRQAQTVNGQAFKRRKNAIKQRWFATQDRLGVLARRAR